MFLARQEVLSALIYKTVCKRPNTLSKVSLFLLCLSEINSSTPFIWKLTTLEEREGFELNGSLSLIRM